MADATKPKSNAGHYDANYGNFESDLYSEIRREAFGEDIGQNSWLTVDEQDSFIPALALSVRWATKPERPSLFSTSH